MLLTCVSFKPKSGIENFVKEMKQLVGSKYFYKGQRISFSKIKG